MRLTTFSDYSVRTLIYLARHPDRFITIAEIAAAWRISPNHLMKVVQRLAAMGDVTTLRGSHGGVRLARRADEIRLGDVIRGSEPMRAPDPGGSGEPWTELQDKALVAFLEVLDAHTLADLAAVGYGDAH